MIDLWFEPNAAVRPSAHWPLVCQLLHKGESIFAAAALTHFVKGPRVVPRQADQDWVALFGLDDREDLVSAPLQLLNVRGHFYRVWFRKGASQERRSVSKVAMNKGGARQTRREHLGLLTS